MSIELIRARFRVWLEKAPPGTRFHSDTQSCPLAAYLRHAGAPDPAVGLTTYTLDGRGQGEATLAVGLAIGHPVGVKTRKLPPWAVDFVELVDIETDGLPNFSPAKAKEVLGLMPD